MNILSGLQAASGLLHGIALARQQPHAAPPPRTSFAELLAASGPDGVKAAERAAARENTARAETLARRYLDLHDANGDGKLSLEESGLDRKTFARLDLDGDGRLSFDELRAHFLGRAG